MSIKKSLHVHEGKVEALSVSPKGKFIASGGIDMNVKLF
jgi:WD40 repeat protein